MKRFKNSRFPVAFAGLSILALLAQACDSSAAGGAPSTTTSSGTSTDASAGSSSTDTGVPQADCVNGALADSVFSSAFSGTAQISEAEQLCAGATTSTSALSCFHTAYSNTYPNGYVASASEQAPNFIVTLCSGATSSAPATCYAGAISDSAFSSAAQNQASLISVEAIGLCRQASNASAPLACFHAAVSDSTFSSNLSLIGNPESLCNQSADSTTALTCFHDAVADSVFSSASFADSNQSSNPVYATAAVFCGGSLQSLYGGFVDGFNPAISSSGACAVD
jgi:hypothetical protein